MDKHSFFIVKFLSAMMGLVTGVTLLGFYPLTNFVQLILILIGIVMCMYLIVHGW